MNKIVLWFHGDSYLALERSPNVMQIGLGTWLVWEDLLLSDGILKFCQDAFHMWMIQTHG